ncbi:MAG: glycosyltransferase family 4 protein, partial [Spirochaetaceae bacterium]|nr:glycosyltransferase family 4 protein [Spirochaetaceae bacterium]
MPRDDEIILGNIIRNKALIIVHEEHQQVVLQDKFGHGDRIRVIPHGIREYHPIPGARDMLGLSGKKVALLAGYFRPTKRFERILGLWPRVVERNPDVVLLLAGKMRGIEYSDYHDSLMRMAKESPVADQILCLSGQFPQYTFDAIISAADCIVLPYEIGAQSGILANAAAFHVPVVTSDLESFVKWNEKSGGGLTAATDDEFVEHLTRILKDDELNRTLRNNVKGFVQPYLWDAIGQKHQAVYEEILRKPFEGTRYFYLPDPEA